MDRVRQGPDPEAKAPECRRIERHGVNGDDRTNSAAVDQACQPGHLNARVLHNPPRVPVNVEGGGGDRAVAEVELDDPVTALQVLSVGQGQRGSGEAFDADVESAPRAELPNVVSSALQALPPQPHVEHAAGVSRSGPALPDEPPEEGWQRRTWTARQLPLGPPQALLVRVRSVVVHDGVLRSSHGR